MTEAPGVSVPDVAGLDLLSAALRYAEAGLYVLPVQRGLKHPGSVVGDRWQDKSSCDPQQIAAWWTCTDYGIALHCGRSGVVAIDVDHPDALPKVLADAIAQCAPPFQSTRSTEPKRGHYLFAMPPDRALGNSVGRLGGGWGEVRGVNGVIIVAPSAHAKADGRYQWVRTGPVPALPASVASLLPESTSAADAANDEQITQFLAQHQRSERPVLLRPVVEKFQRDVKEGASRHTTAVICMCWAARESAAGCYPADRAAKELGALFVAALADEPDRYPVSEWRGILAWAIGQAVADDHDSRRAEIERRMPSARTLVTQLRDQLSGWLDLPDPAPLLCALAVAATAHDTEGEPAWLLLVHVPSSGKTEIVRLLDDIAKAHLDDVTVAGLLSWSRGKNPQRTGVLSRVKKGLLTFGDLSTLIASSEKTGSRDEIFALLRRVYDGSVTRNVGAPSGAGTSGPLAWTGRLSIIGAVTGVIDQYSAHAAALGSRWLYCRLPERNTEAKRRAAKLARQGGLTEHRNEARDLATTAVHPARQRLPHLTVPPGSVADSIEESALVCTWGRAAVPRNGYGAREIDGPAVVEEPHRLIRQLTTLARGLLALDQDADEVRKICRRVALDSMPEVRRRVLTALAGRAANKATAAVATAAGLDRGVARRALEELEVIGVVRGERRGPDVEGDWPDRRPCFWSLLGDDGDLIAQVIKETDIE